MRVAVGNHLAVHFVGDLGKVAERRRHLRHLQVGLKCRFAIVENDHIAQLVAMLQCIRAFQ